MPSICFVNADNYPILNPAAGGSYAGGESVQQTLLARAFRDRGWRVSMVCQDYGQPDGEVVDGIQVWKTCGPEEGLPVVRFLYPRLTSALAALKRADADVYYQSCAGVMTGYTAWHAKRAGRKFLFRIAHDTDCIPGEEIMAFARDRIIYRWGLKHADWISAQSQGQMTLLHRNLELASTVINMTVDLPATREESSRTIDVLWVNNLRQFKRPDLCLELAKRLPDREFTMIGGPVAGEETLYEEIEAAAALLPNLSFLGAVPYHQVNDFFWRASLFLNTSDSEGFPNSYLQAWARWVPVVAFFDPDGVIARDGLGDVPESPEAMAAALDRLLKDAHERERLGGQGRRFVEERFSAPAVVDRYIDLMMGEHQK